MSKQNEPPLGGGGAGPILFYIGMIVAFFIIQALMGCAVVSQQVQAPTPVGVEVAWVAVGDSIMNNARPHMYEAMPPGGVLYGEVHSGPHTAVLAHEGYVPLMDRVREHPNAKVLVIQDDAREESIESYTAFMDEVRATVPSACIVWVTPWSAFSREHDAEIASLIQSRLLPRERIAAWGTATEEGGYLTTDGVHLSTYGGRVFARIVADAVASC